jgi:hypothetical protein
MRFLFRIQSALSDSEAHITELDGESASRQSAAAQRIEELQAQLEALQVSEMS